MNGALNSRSQRVGLPVPLSFAFWWNAALLLAPQNALYRQHLQQAQAKAKMADKAEKAANRLQ